MIPSWAYNMVVADAQNNHIRYRVWFMKISTREDDLAEWLERQ